MLKVDFSRRSAGGVNFPQSVQTNSIKRQVSFGLNSGRVIDLITPGFVDRFGKSGKEIAEEFDTLMYAALPLPARGIINAEFLTNAFDKNIAMKKELAPLINQVNDIVPQFKNSDNALPIASFYNPEILLNIASSHLTPIAKSVDDVAEKFGMSNAVHGAFRDAAYLHDIGKPGIHSKVIESPDRFGPITLVNQFGIETTVKDPRIAYVDKHAAIGSNLLIEANKAGAGIHPLTIFLTENHHKTLPDKATRQFLAELEQDYFKKGFLKPNVKKETTDVKLGGLSHLKLPTNIDELVLLNQYIKHLDMFKTLDISSALASKRCYKDAMDNAAILRTMEEGQKWNITTGAYHKDVLCEVQKHTPALVVA